MVLSLSAWRHIVEEHGELNVHRAAVLAAVRDPDRQMAGRSSSEEWYYLATERPSGWVKVVVHFDRGEGRIVTAFPRTRFP